MTVSNVLSFEKDSEGDGMLPASALQYSTQVFAH